MPGRIELACADRAVDQPAQEIGQPLIARVVAALRRHGLLCPLPQVRIYDGWHDARGQRHAENDIGEARHAPPAAAARTACAHLLTISRTPEGYTLVTCPLATGG